MDKALWTKWKNDWDFMISVAEKKDWDYSEPEIKKAVSEEEIAALEKELGVIYPFDFKQILTEYASAVHFNWHMDEDEIEGFESLFCGGSDGLLWDFKYLKPFYESYLGWIKQCFADPSDEYNKVWHNKIPFLEVGNGDRIAFDIPDDEGNCPIIFLSHDGSDFHGSRLAANFIDFITRWSNIGCIGTEDWQLEVFYDFDQKILMDDSSVIDEWKKCLGKSK